MLNDKKPKYLVDVEQENLELRDSKNSKKKHTHLISVLRSHVILIRNLKLLKILGSTSVKVMVMCQTSEDKVMLMFLM